MLFKWTLILLCAFLITSCFGDEELAGQYATISISDGPSYNFGTVNVSSSSDKTFTLTNSGTVTASLMEGAGLAAPFNFKGGSYPGTGGTCTGSLAIAETCDVIVTYSPTTGQTSTDTLLIYYDNGTFETSASRDLIGTGNSGAPVTTTLIISDGPTYDFGSLLTGNTTSRAFTVTNVGATIATSLSGTGLAAPFSFFGGTYPGTGGTCPSTLAAAASCTIMIAFTPTLPGVASDTIELNYSAGGSAIATRDIQGTGI